MALSNKPIKSFVLFLSVLSTACGGSSSSDAVDPGKDNTNPQSEFTIVPLSSLPPLSERLYGGAEYSTRITGPVVGKAEVDNSQLIHDVGIEQEHGFSAIVIEEAYMLNVVDPADTTVTTPPMQFMAVATNVSNALICRLKFGEISYVTNNGQSYDYAESGFRGFNAIELNADALNKQDDYSTDCIPPGKSAYVINRVQFDSVLAGGPQRAQDFEKVIFKAIEGSVAAGITVATTGYSADSYTSTNRGSGFDFYLSVKNSSDKNLFFREFSNANMVFFIDTATGKPLGFTAFAGFQRNTEEYPEWSDFGGVLAPGQNESDIIFFNSVLFRGSTNTIIATFDWLDNDRTGLQDP